MNRFDNAVELSFIEMGILHRVSQRLIPLGWPKGAIMTQLRIVLPMWDEDNIAAAADNIFRGVEVGSTPSQSPAYTATIDKRMEHPTSFLTPP